MKPFIDIFRFYIHSNIHVSIASACLVLITGKLYKLDVLLPALFVGFATFVSYNFISFLKKKNKVLKVDISGWFTKFYNLLLFLFIVSVSSLLFISYRIGISNLLVVLPFGLMTLFYMLPVFKFGKRKLSLREIPGIKIFSIAISWAGLSSFFPLLYTAHILVVDDLLFFLQLILFVFVLTLPFDIRDVEFDKKSLRTVPQVMGVVKTKILGVFCLFVGLFLQFYLFGKNLFFSTVIIYVLLMFLLGFSSRKQSSYYASFWVESIPVFWYLLICFI
ncbi:hypothetical protein ACFLRU_03155 [Bacteroidota bacterium]